MDRKRVMFLSSFLIFTFILNIGAISSLTTVNSKPIHPTIDKEEISPDLYTSIDNSPLNIKEEMTLSPMFTPDNALDIHAAWLQRANSTIDVQNQYIKKFDDGNWSSDSNPIVNELVAAANRGVNIRVQVREDSDSDLVATYLDGITNIEARYMGSESTADADGYWLSNTHNKMIIIDTKVSLISSINFGENAFYNNREAGMVIQNTQVANYFLKFFEEDWADGETNIHLEISQSLSSTTQTEADISIDQGESHTNIPRSNFTGTYNVSAYVNPDNADNHIFKYLKSAEESIYVSMYTISREDFVDELIKLKQNKPTLDIQVLISRRRVGASENVDTQQAALRLVDNLIPVYNSTSNLNFYHNKYWLIDGQHSFIYSGNWSPRSVTPEETEYTSGYPNRDMGVAVHNAPDIANFIKTEVWDKDVAVAVPYELPVGIKQNSFDQSEVVSGTIDLTATVSELSNPTVSYSFGDKSGTNVELADNSFSISVDTTTMDNGITTFSVSATDENGVTYEDEVDVNIVNIPDSDNFRFLITEIHPNPDVVDDSEGEYFELTNSFPFSLIIEGWQTGDDDDRYTFGINYQIAAYSSIIIARDATGFSDGFNREADIELGIELTNSKDYIQLLDQSGDFVDVVAYGDITAPDNSEAITETFDPGQSIARDPLHIDTNTAADFIIAEPSPKADVPHIELGEVGDDTNTNLPFPIITLMTMLIAIPVIRRKL